MADWKSWWKKNDKQKNGCGCTSDCKPDTGDCKCGCTDSARDSVRLTDVEMAHDIIGELTYICDNYACLCKEGCDCEDKLQSCMQSREKLCEFVEKN